jgi:hypothetical protein
MVMKQSKLVEGLDGVDDKGPIDSAIIGFFIIVSRSIVDIGPSRWICGDESVEKDELNLTRRFVLSGTVNDWNCHSKSFDVGNLDKNVNGCPTSLTLISVSLPERSFPSYTFMITGPVGLVTVQLPKYFADISRILLTILF